MSKQGVQRQCDAHEFFVQHLSSSMHEMVTVAHGDVVPGVRQHCNDDVDQ